MSIPLRLLLLAFALFSPFLVHAEIFTVRITEFGFDPSSVKLAAGDAIEFVNDDDAPHWPASDVHPTHSEYPGSDVRQCGTETESQIFDACHGLVRGESYRFTFTEPGEWGFHDHLHPALAGNAKVFGFPTQDRPGEAAKPLSFGGKIAAYLLRAWYRLMPERGIAKLASLSVIEVAQKDADIEYWMTVYGSSKLLDKLVKDADEKKEGQCHTEAHFLGRIAYLRENIPLIEERGIDTRCAFGFYHGVLETALGFIGDDEEIKKFIGQCESNTEDPVRRIFCHHAIGHGLLTYSGYDLPGTITKCHALFETERGRQLCYNGAFMENVFASLGVGAAGHDTEWMDETRPDFPCTSPNLPNLPFVREHCYINQSIFWARPMTTFNEQAAFDGCSRAPMQLQRRCFGGVGLNMVLMTTGLSDEAVMHKCLSTPSGGSEPCLIGAAFMRAAIERNSNFANPIYCRALKLEPDTCHKFIREQMSWALF